MRRFASLVLAFVCVLAVSMRAQTTPSEEQANNTPACAASAPPSYCYLPAQYQPPLSTNPANQNQGINPPIQTVVVDTVGHIESVPYLPIGKLMPKVGSNPWAGKVICEYQPWFSVNGNSSWGGAVSEYNGHIDIGYDEDAYDSNNTFNSAAPTQDTAMISQGCNINLINFYGFAEEPSQAFNLDTTNNVYADLLGRYNSTTGTYPMQFAIMEDKDAFKASCDLEGSESAEETCIENYLVSDVEQAYETYMQSNAGLYWTDSSNSTHGPKYVIAIFAACGDFALLTCPTANNPQDDWQTIWNVVYPEVAALNDNIEFIFEYGQFGYPSVPSSAPSYLNAGQYAWPQPFSGLKGQADCQSAKNCFISDPQTQFWWCDSGYAGGGVEVPCEGEGEGSPAYLDRFYTDAAAKVPNGQIAVGAIYKGFDDSNATWWSDRVIAQQCGQVLLGTAQELTYEANSNITSYWATHQMPYMQVATWNDYEEGTEVESGVDNCLRVSNLQQGTVNGVPSLTWSVTSLSAGYGTTSTIDHFTIWFGSPTGNPNDPIQVAATTPSGSGGTTSIPLSQLNLPRPRKDYAVDLYVEAVGVPLVLNQMSSYWTYEY